MKRFLSLLRLRWLFIYYITFSPNMLIRLLIQCCLYSIITDLTGCDCQPLFGTIWSFNNYRFHIIMFHPHPAFCCHIFIIYCNCRYRNYTGFHRCHNTSLGYLRHRFIQRPPTNSRLRNVLRHTDCSNRCGPSRTNCQLGIVKQNICCINLF